MKNYIILRVSAESSICASIGFISTIT